MKIILFLIFSLSLQAAFAQDSGVYAAMSNKEKNRGLIVIMGEAAKDIFNLLELEVITKKIISCDLGTGKKIENTIEMKKGSSLNCEHELETESFTCYHSFNTKDGGAGDKALESLNYPCGK